VETETENK